MQALRGAVLQACGEPLGYAGGDGELELGERDVARGGGAADAQLEAAGDAAGGGGRAQDLAVVGAVPGEVERGVGGGGAVGAGDGAQRPGDEERVADGPFELGGRVVGLAEEVG